MDVITTVEAVGFHEFYTGAGVQGGQHPAQGVGFGTIDGRFQIRTPLDVGETGGIRAALPKLPPTVE